MPAFSLPDGSTGLISSNVPIPENTSAGSNSPARKLLFPFGRQTKSWGPYEQVENLYNPGGHKIGDFDIVVDDTTDTGYLYCETDQRSILCLELTADYLHTSKELIRNYPDLHPPFTREASACLRQTM